MPIVCRETAAELLRVLAYPKFRLTGAEQDALLGDYLPFTEVVRLPQPPPALPMACRDRDDGMFLQLAITARADALCSGDADLTVLREQAPVRIVSVDELRRAVAAP